MSSTFRQQPLLPPLLTKLGVPKIAQGVFTILLTQGPLAATQIARQCHLSRPNAYSILAKLTSLGFVHELGTQYGKQFAAISTDEMETLCDRKVKEAESLRKDIAQVLSQSPSPTTTSPSQRLSFFDGVDGIKRLILFTLTCQSKLIRTITSIKRWDALLGKEFTEFYVSRRITRKIYSQTLRDPRGELKDPFHDEREKHLREVRYLPKGISAASTLMLYDTAVISITTGDECFGVMIQNKDLSQTIGDIFSNFWKQNIRR